MLDFLVTSRVRREILYLLVEGVSGTVSEFAQKAEVGFASAYRELHAMGSIGVASSSHENGREVFRVNAKHPLTQAVKMLSGPLPLPPVDDRVWNQLFTLGAPIFGEEVPVDDRERALVEGVALSHQSGTIASVLSVVFYMQRDAMDPEKLVFWAKRYGEKQALGFFLDLTGELSGDARFSKWAEKLHDRRWRKKMTYLFHGDDHSELSREITERNTPLLARKWHLLANMTMDDLVRTFKKHTQNVTAFPKNQTSN